MHLITRSMSLAALAALFVCPLDVMAQQQAGQRERQREGQQSRQSGSQTDGQLAAVLIIDNQKEIALAEIAAQEAQNEQVKQFAQKMIQDHKQFVQQLQRFAESAGIQEQQFTLESGATGERSRSTTQQRPQQAEREERSREEESTARRAARPAELGEGSQQGVNFVSLKKELAQQSLQSIRQDLQEKSGSEFDHCYMFGQVMAHMHMADALKVFSKHASPQLQETLQKGLQTTQQHLTQAKQIAQQVERSSQSQ